MLFLFWILVLTVTLWVAIEYDQAVGATAALLIFLVLAQFTTDYGAFTFLWNYPLTFFPLVGLHLALGGGWSVVKWFLTVQRNRRDYLTLREEFLANRGLAPMTGTALTEMPASLLNEWRAHVTQARVELPPLKYRNHKSEIYLWITFWEWSLLWTVCHDLAKNAVRWIYERLAGVYARIASIGARGLEGDFSPRP